MFEHAYNYMVPGYLNGRVNTLKLSEHPGHSGALARGDAVKRSVTRTIARLYDRSRCAH